MTAARAVLARILALPREAGSPAAAEARDLVARHLRALGWQVELQRFRFSTAALNAFPLFGAGLGGLAVLLLPLLLLPGVPPWAALPAAAAGLAALAAVAGSAGTGAVAIGGEEREDANLVATRGPEPVRRWIVAHLDTKAQGHSMAGRLVAVWLVVAAAVALLALAAWRLHGPVPAGAAAAGAALALGAGSQAGRGRLRGLSQGARDNGSGIAGLLAAAEAGGSGVGLLVTSAEEFGLVGARCFAQAMPERLLGTEVVNLDTLDDAGDVYLVSHDGPGEALARAVAPALAPLGMPLRLRSLPLGIFVDSYPLARAGARAITIGRLTWGTLRRVHTPDDRPDDLALDAAEAVGRAVSLI